MRTRFLNVRLTQTEVRLIARLREQTGLSKSALVRHALETLSEKHAGSAGDGLYALGAARFGRHADAARQSAQIKRVARERLDAKRSR